MERIHIVGLGPRTGTTLLAECMVASFDIDAFDAHETPLYRFRRNARVYLTKLPGDLQSIGPRLRVDPHFHVICMMRDPRDMVTSRHDEDPARYWAPLRLWKERLVTFRRLAGHKRFIVVRYEDLVADPDGTQATIAARLPFLRQTDAFSRFHLRARPSGMAVKALGGLRAVEASRIGNWRNHLPRLAGQLERHGPIAAELIDLGYERDYAWLSALDGVEPDRAASRWPEHPDMPARYRRATRRVRAVASLAVLLARRLAGQSIA
jgi:hypothetical protein